MAMGGEPTEVRDAGGAKATKMEEEGKPLVGGVGAAGSGAVGNADVERALARFAEAAASSPAAPPKIPAELSGVLQEISSVGVPYYGWGGLKELLAARMAEAVGALEKESGFSPANDGKAYAQRRDELVASLRRFDAAPFTLQRLAEVLQDPRRQYLSTHKLINGLERLLAVSTTLPVRPRKGVVRAASTSTSCPGAAATSNGAAHPSAGSAASQSQGSQEKAAVAVAVKVELGGAALVPEEEVKPIVEEGSANVWESEEGNEGRGQGPGRKRLKVELSSEEAVMSE